MALKVSCLVILAGMSGTGKSGLVRLYADAMGLPKEQAVMIPVRPSWMDDSDLLGYLDMKNMIYRPADTGLAELLVDAARHPEKMYIVCFDEMNLARAEHYFAQFISVLEQEEHRVIRLYNPSLMPRIYNSASYPAEIPVGRNVIFTGTVNVDESTYHFSDKILDRANVITLHQGKFRDLAKLERTEAERWPEVSASEWEAFRRTSDTVALTETELDFLDALNEALQQGGLQGGIGYRVARQMGRYLLNIPEGRNSPARTASTARPCSGYSRSSAAPANSSSRWPQRTKRTPHRRRRSGAGPLLPPLVLHGIQKGPSPEGAGAETL